MPCLIAGGYHIAPGLPLCQLLLEDLVLLLNELHLAPHSTTQRLHGFGYVLVIPRLKLVAGHFPTKSTGNQCDLKLRCVGDRIATLFLSSSITSTSLSYSSLLCDQSMGTKCSKKNCNVGKHIFCMRTMMWLGNSIRSSKWLPMFFWLGI